MKVIKVERRVLETALKMIDDYFYCLVNEWSSGPLSGLETAREYYRKELYCRGTIKRLLKKSFEIPEGK